MFLYLNFAKQLLWKVPGSPGDPAVCGPRVQKLPSRETGMGPLLNPGMLPQFISGEWDMSTAYHKQLWGFLVRDGPPPVAPGLRGHLEKPCLQQEGHSYWVQVRSTRTPHRNSLHVPSTASRGGGARRERNTDQTQDCLGSEHPLDPAPIWGLSHSLGCPWSHTRGGARVAEVSGAQLWWEVLSGPGLGTCVCSWTPLPPPMPPIVTSSGLRIFAGKELRGGTVALGGPNRGLASDVPGRCGGTRQRGVGTSPPCRAPTSGFQTADWEEVRFCCSPPGLHICGGTSAE